MGHPSTLSSLQFTGIYAAGLGLTVLIPLALWRVIRQAPDRQITRELDPYEVGYLVGGVRRAAEVVIAELVCSGALRVEFSSGRLSEADRAARTGAYADALDRMTPTGMPDGRKARGIRNKLGSDPEIVMIGRGLRRDGLAIPGRQVAILRLITVVLMLALLAIWILRIIDLGNNGRAIFVMLMLMILTVWADIMLLILYLATCPNATTLGIAYLRLGGIEGAYLKPLEGVEPSPPAARQSGVYDRAESPQPATAAVPAAVLFDIARRGFGAVPDMSIRDALLRGLEIPGFKGGGEEGGG